MIRMHDMEVFNGTEFASDLVGLDSTAMAF